MLESKTGSRRHASASESTCSRVKKKTSIVSDEL